MHNLSSINRSINSVMAKYLVDHDHEDDILFDSKAVFNNIESETGSVIFTMTIQEDGWKFVPFKAALSIEFLNMMEEDNIVKMICNMFKNIISQCSKIDDKHHLTTSLSNK